MNIQINGFSNHKVSKSKKNLKKLETELARETPSVVNNPTLAQFSSVTKDILLVFSFNSVTQLCSSLSLISGNFSLFNGVSIDPFYSCSSVLNLSMISTLYGEKE